MSQISVIHGPVRGAMNEAEITEPGGVHGVTPFQPNGESNIPAFRWQPTKGGDKMSELNRDAAALALDAPDTVRGHLRRHGGSIMARYIAAAMLATGIGLGVAAPAYSLDYQAGPPGAQVVARVAVTRFPALPPNPCVRLPNVGFADNPVLPPNPCFADRSERS